MERAADFELECSVLLINDSWPVLTLYSVNRLSMSIFWIRLRCRTKNVATNRVVPHDSLPYFVLVVRASIGFLQLLQLSAASIRFLVWRHGNRKGVGEES